jgi:hypothetical protein
MEGRSMGKKENEIYFANNIMNVLYNECIIQ